MPLRIRITVASAFSLVFNSLRDRLLRKFRRSAEGEARGAAPAAEESPMRRSRAMASLFPCFYRKEHPHPVGRPHTCNSFLIGPSDYLRREGFRAGAHTIVVSHWSSRARRGAA